jgi:hypothetical protein
MQPGPGAGPAPFTPPPQLASGREVRPSLWWFAVAGGLALAGIVGGIALLWTGVTRVTDRVDDFTRIAVPSSGEVSIDDPGGYSIYHEYFGAGDDDDFGDSQATPGVTVTDPSGAEVALRSYTTSVTYDFGGHEGEGVFTFEAEEAGTYQVTTTGDSTSTIAVGPGIGRGLVSSIVGGLAVGALGVIGGIVLAIVTGVRRSSSRRKLNAARWRQQGPPGMPGAPGAPGGWGAPPGPVWGQPQPGPAGAPGWGQPMPPPVPPPPDRPSP